MHADEYVHLCHVSDGGRHVQVLEGYVLHGGAHVLCLLYQHLHLLEVRYHSGGVLWSVIVLQHSDMCK